MGKKVTEQMILQIHSKCSTLIKNELFLDSTEQKTELRMESAAFLEAIAWKILLPLFLTIIGGLSVQVIKRKYLSNNMAQNRAETMKSIGKEIIISSPEQSEELIIMIHEALKPLGISRKQARYIFDMLIQDILEQQIKGN